MATVWCGGGRLTKLPKVFGSALEADCLAVSALIEPADSTRTAHLPCVRWRVVGISTFVEVDYWPRASAARSWQRNVDDHRESGWRMWRSQRVIDCGIFRKKCNEWNSVNSVISVTSVKQALPHDCSCSEQSCQNVIFMLKLQFLGFFRQGLRFFPPINRNIALPARPGNTCSPEIAFGAISHSTHFLSYFTAYSSPPTIWVACYFFELMTVDFEPRPSGRKARSWRNAWEPTACATFFVFPPNLRKCIHKEPGTDS